MQFDRAQELRKLWGDKPCNHPEVDKEYYLGAQTGDLVCTQCGSTFLSYEEVEASRNAMRKQEDN
jgi:hypothetical protein